MCDFIPFTNLHSTLTLCILQYIMSYNYFYTVLLILFLFFDDHHCYFHSHHCYYHYIMIFIYYGNMYALKLFPSYRHQSDVVVFASGTAS